MYFNNYFSNWMHFIRYRLVALFFPLPDFIKTNTSPQSKYADQQICLMINLIFFSRYKSSAVKSIASDLILSVISLILTQNRVTHACQIKWRKRAEYTTRLKSAIFFYYSLISSVPSCLIKMLKGRTLSTNEAIWINSTKYRSHSTSLWIVYDACFTKV